MERPTSYLELLPPEVGAQVMQLVEENQFFKLMELPYEVQLYAMAQVRYPDLMNFCALGTTVSKKVGRICNDDFFWKLKTQRDFGARFPEANDEFPTYASNWKAEYEHYLGVFGEEFVKAAKEGNLEKVQELVEFGVDVDIKEQAAPFPILPFGNTALLWASKNGYPDIVWMLLEAGAEVDIQNNSESTALMNAALNHAEIVQMLIDAGADLDIENDRGETALHWAIRSSEITRMLIEAGADFDIQDEFGDTVLLDASHEGFTDIVRLLIDAGADLNIQNNDGVTALMVASERGWVEIQRMLRDAGAR